MDRVTHVAPEHASGWNGLRQEYLTALASQRYPASDGPTSIVLPIVFPGLGGPADSLLATIQAPAA